jgi:hypothetical protein
VFTWSIFKWTYMFAWNKGSSPTYEWKACYYRPFLYLKSFSFLCQSNCNCDQLKYSACKFSALDKKYLAGAISFLSLLKPQWINKNHSREVIFNYYEPFKLSLVSIIMNHLKEVIFYLSSKIVNFF